MRMKPGVALLVFATLIGTAQAWSAGPEVGDAKEVKRSFTGRVELNSASKAELAALPGVGPVTAEEIVAARPFKSVDQLKDVKGIGDARFRELRDLVTVSRQLVDGLAGAAADKTKAKTEPAALGE